MSGAVVAGTLRGASTSFSRDGVNVTVNGSSEPQAMPAEHIELQPGESSTVDLVTSPDNCDPPPGNGLLPPGRYELYVIWRMQEFTPGNSTGRPIELYSGPIAVELP